MLRVARIAALLFGALALGLTSAHVLELPQKMKYGAELYAAVNTTLYLYFAVLGGLYCVLETVALVWLAYLVRGDRYAFRWTLVSLCLFAVWWASWLGIV